jgi:nucleotide-binding universal stress UspA family protein
VAQLLKILAPVDFSEQSVGAARYAQALARHVGADLTVLHVVEAETRQPPVWPQELDEGPIRRLLLPGDPARVIVTYARDQKVDLIVMPTHGHGPFGRFLLGSVTAKVLHDADCAVWTGVHLEQVPPIESLHGGNVLCAVDLGSHSAAVVAWAARMAERFGAGFVVVHAIPSIEAHAGEYFDAAWRARVENQAIERLEDLLRAAGSRAEVLVLCGDAPRVVRCAAQRYRAALVVIGRGSAAGEFGRLRANAYAILRESPGPVVSV